MQTEDMDISPLEDTSSPVSTDSRSIPGPSGIHSHSHQGHSHPHLHHHNQKSLLDGLNSRDDVKHMNSVGHQQGGGRLIHHNSRSHHDEHRSRYYFVDHQY